MRINIEEQFSTITSESLWLCTLSNFDKCVCLNSNITITARVFVCVTLCHVWHVCIVVSIYKWIYLYFLCIEKENQRQRITTNMKAKREHEMWRERESFKRTLRYEVRNSKAIQHNTFTRIHMRSTKETNQHSAMPFRSLSTVSRHTLL